MSEIIAKIGLDHARFDRGLDEASRGWEAWAQKIRRAPIQLVPEKSARDSARVFEDIERARQEHVGNLDRGRMERALGGPSGKSAADSASVFQEQAAAEKALADARARRAFDEANTVGRIRITQRELVTLARQRDALQVGTVARLRAEQQIEERLLQLRQLQRQQQSANSVGLPSLQQVDQQATGILGMLRKKFSGANLFKDVLRTFGLGIGVGAIGSTISDFFSAAAEKAKATAAHTADLYAGTLRIIGVIGGPRREMQLQVKAAKDVNQEIAMQRKLIADLQSGMAAMALLTPAGRQQLADAENGLNTLIAKQAELRNQIQAGNVEEFRKNAATERQGLLQMKLARVELEHGSEMAKIDERRAHLQRELQVRASQGALQSELTDISNQISALDTQRAIAVRNRREALEDTRRRGEAENKLAELELNHATELDKFDERRRALLQEIAVLRERNAPPAEIEAQQNRIRLLDTERAIYARNQREKIEDLKRAKQLDDELTRAELDNAGEVEKMQIRLNALRREEAVLKKRTGIMSPEVAANQNSQTALINAMKVEQDKNRKAIAPTLVGIGVSVSGGQPPRRPRGRSEMERIADRGQGFIAQAEEGIRTGKSPEYIARMAKAARVDLETVGGKVGQATSKVAGEDAKALSSELFKANTTLKNIEKNLAPTKVK